MKKIALLFLLGEMLSGIFSPGYGQTSLTNRPAMNPADPFICNNFNLHSLKTQLDWSSANRSSAAQFTPVLWTDSLSHPGKDTLPLPHQNYLRNDDPAFNR